MAPRTPLIGLVIISVAFLLTLAAPFLATHPADVQFPGLLNAPPTVVHVQDDAGRWRPPFVYAWRLTSQLEQRYVTDRRVVPLIWFADGRLVQSSDDQRAPLLLLGADSFGRDVFSRLLSGARVSLGLSLSAGLLAILLGSLAGAIAGYRGGIVDDLLMRASEFVLVLPAMYAALALRVVLPAVLDPPAIFVLLASIFAVLGAPIVARGVRGIVRAERAQDYALAAVSLGAGPWRITVRHLLPAAAGFLLVQLTVLLPGFIVAEATFSYLGLGFPDAMATWGTMLQEASSVRAFVDFPWLLSPAAAMFVVVVGLHLAGQGRSERSPFEQTPTL